MSTGEEEKKFSKLIDWKQTRNSEYYSTGRPGDSPEALPLQGQYKCPVLEI